MGLKKRCPAADRDQSAGVVHEGKILSFSIFSSRFPLFFRIFSCLPGCHPSRARGLSSQLYELAGGSGKGAL